MIRGREKKIGRRRKIKKRIRRKRVIIVKLRIIWMKIVLEIF